MYSNEPKLIGLKESELVNTIKLIMIGRKMQMVWRWICHRV